MISIVVPLYNKELSIKNTIESVLNQTYENFEIVIVNDGSTDNSLGVVQAIKDERIRIISKINGGVSSARNVGIKNAASKWVAFLDADDHWQPNHLQVLQELKDQYSNASVFTTNFGFPESVDKQKGETTSRIVDYFAESTERKLINSSTCLIAVSCFEEVGYFNENLSRGEDLEMWYRLAKKFDIVRSEIQTVIYRLEAENRAMNNSASYEKSFASVIDMRNAETKDEKAYLKSQILAKYKSCLYNREWLNLWKCFRQHQFSFI